MSRQWLVAVEQGHGRAELDKVNGLLQSVGLTLSTEPAPAVRPEGERTRDRDRTWATAAETAEAVRAEIARGDTDFALRVLAQGLADFRRLTYPDDVARFLAEPPSTGDQHGVVLPGRDELLLSAQAVLDRMAKRRPPRRTLR